MSSYALSGRQQADAIRRLQLDDAYTPFDPKARQHGAGLRRMLQRGNETFGIAVLTDSTANGTDEWFYLLGQQIGAAYPGYTILWYLWDDTSQDYLAPTTVQSGAAGARSVRFPGTGNTMSIPDAAVPQPASDIDIAIDLSCDDWTPAADMGFVAKYGNAPQRTFRFELSTGGSLKIETSTDGTAVIGHLATVPTGFVDGSRHWVRAVVDVDNGAAGHDVKFYSSTDGVAWTQMGATVTTAGVISLFDSTSSWELGGRGTNPSFTGNIYQVQIRDGILGPIVAPVFPEQWAFPTTAQQTRVGAPVLALLAGAMGGQGLTYLSDPTRIKKLLRDASLRSVFLSTGHNEGSTRDKDWFTRYVAWVNATRGYAYQATPIVMSQNPRFSPADHILGHEQRRNIYASLAAQLGIPFIDVFQAFLDTGVASTLVGSDGIHPTNSGVGDGFHVWADHVYKALALS